MTAPESSGGRLLERSPYLFGEDSAFVLAAGGLRRLRGRGQGFLGYSAREMFWLDALGLIHEEDLPHARTLLATVKRHPGSSLDAALRFRDANGDWTLMDITIQNVLEAAGDAGFVVANIRDPRPPEGPFANGHSPDGHSEA